MREGIRENKDNSKIIMNDVFHNEFKYSFAYFAGWADGDGCFHPKDNPTSYELRIRNEEPVYQLSDLYRSSVRLATAEKREWLNESDRRKVTQLYGHRFIHFCKGVAPFLIEKQYLAIKGLELKGITDFKCSYKEHNKNEFIQYLAGFLEAEGHFQYSPKSYQYSVQVNNYNKDVIEFIVSNLKKYLNTEAHLVVKHVPKMTQGPNGKGGEVYERNQSETYFTMVSGKKAKPMLEAILPYMKIDYKIEAANNILKHDYKN
tara:strand:+ start:138 stop:917 length:780 start_codon:yes stop_codon:yes gene_type:complete